MPFQVVNMKLTLLLLVIGIGALTAANVPRKTADKAYLKKQRDVLLILKYISQLSYYKEFVDIGNTYDITKAQGDYTNQEAVQKFLQYYKYGLLPRGDIFSVFNYEQLDEAIATFRLFYYAKDYDTFYKTAVWARQNLNEGLFLYSFVVAVVHRQDTQDVVLPPIYEVYPYYFFNAEDIYKAYRYKQEYSGQTVLDGTTGYNGYTINSNYSGYYLNLHPEQSLSYYTEDVGILSFYYYYNIYFPFWMDSKEYGIDTNRGEQFYFFYQQFLARYYLERISNYFGEIPYISWNTPVETPYSPSLQYSNGVNFPSRPQFARLEEYYRSYAQSWSLKGPYGFGLDLIEDYERRIDDVLDYGYVYKGSEPVEIYKNPDGLNILGNLVQGNRDSYNFRYYGPIWWFASNLLGYSYHALNKHSLVPSALEHFETAPRDPVFYQFYKRLVLKFLRYYVNLPSYTEKDLIYEGVQVKEFNVDRLITYFDYHYVDLSNAVYYSEDEQQKDNFNVRAKQYRLNNKPFKYKITVNSDQDRKSVVKVWLGPKYDEYGRYINLTENRLNFVLFDYFVYSLKAGENVISRNSYDNYFFAPDCTSYKELYKQVLGASAGQSQIGTQNYFFFPRRYILPKGDYAGVPYQFYVIVYPKESREAPTNQKYESYWLPFEDDEKQFYDKYPLGYPFDRFIRFEKLWYQVPNSYFYETKIYHKDDVNTVLSNN